MQPGTWGPESTANEKKFKMQPETLSLQSKTQIKEIGKATWSLKSDSLRQGKGTWNLQPKPQEGVKERESFPYE